MRTQVTELPDSRMRVDVEVEPDLVARRVERAARDLAREMKLPGFRKGKVPTELVLQRIGREAVVEQALRDSLPEWYERALLEARISPIGDPQLSVPSLPGEGEGLQFAIEVAVRPKAKLGKYKGLDVGRAEAEVPDEAVGQELDRLREGFASLEPVERPARPGDLVLIDHTGTVDGEPTDELTARDLMVEVGSESLLPEVSEALEGASAGDDLTVEFDLPQDGRPQDLAGKRASLTVAVKEVREKRLPALDDEFASEASEFETLDELREAIRSRIAEALERRAEAAFREAAVDAAADEATIEIPAELVHARAHEAWERFERALGSREVSAESWLRLQGKTREQAVAEAEPAAERDLRREATLAAVAEAEAIEVGEEELLEALGPGEGDEAPERILARLREAGRDALLGE